MLLALRPKLLNALHGLDTAFFEVQATQTQSACVRAASTSCHRDLTFEIVRTPVYEALLSTSFLISKRIFFSDLEWQDLPASVAQVCSFGFHDYPRPR